MRRLQAICSIGFFLAGVGAARADLGNDLLDDVTQPGLLDVNRVAGSMPADARTQLGVDLSQSKILDVAPELENGTDVGFGFNDINKKSFLGKAGVVLGDVNESEVDVRGGFYLGNSKGVVIFGFQLGEPDRIRRASKEVLVSQSRDVAVFLNVTWLDGTNPMNESDIAVVRKCSVRTTFRDKNGDHTDENLPDFGSWIVDCDRGWNKSLEALTDAGRKAVDKVLGGKAFRVSGQGDWLDIDQALQNFNIPIL